MEDTWSIILEMLEDRKYLFCKHCGKHEQPITKFKYTLIKMFIKGKLSRDNLPLTCDSQSEQNLIWNSFNNKIYPLRKKIKILTNQITVSFDSEEIQFLKESRQQLIYMLTGYTLAKRHAMIRLGVNPDYK